MVFLAFKPQETNPAHFSMDSGIESTESSNGSLAETYSADNLFGAVNKSSSNKKDVANVPNESGGVAQNEHSTADLNNLRCSVQTQTSTSGISMDTTKACNSHPNFLEKGENSTFNSSDSDMSFKSSDASHHSCSSNCKASDSNRMDNTCNQCNQSFFSQDNLQKSINDLKAKGQSFSIPEGSKLQLHFSLPTRREESREDSFDSRLFRKTRIEHAENPDGKFAVPEGHRLEIHFSLKNSNQHDYDILPGLSFDNVSVTQCTSRAQDSCSQGYAVLPYESRDLQRKFKHYRRRLQVFSTTPKEKKLRLAASYNNLELVEKLLKDGVDPKAMDEKKRTALHIAAAKGHTQVVRRLLDFGADPNQKDAAGNNPLHLAACTSHLDTVTVLLKAGTDVKQVDNQGQSPLHLAKSRLKLLQKNSASSSLELKTQVTQVVNMIKTYLEMAGNQEDAELLAAFSNQLSLSDTRQKVESDLQSLLDSLNELDLNKVKQP